MNMRKLSINKACVLLGTLLLLAAVMAFPVGVSALAASPAEGAQIETAAEGVEKTAEYGIYDMGDFDPPEAGPVLRCLLWSDG